jgi:outer membrane receptor protein involved in Fe transport
MNPTNYVGQWIHIFTPQLLNELRFGNNHQIDALTNPRSNTNFDLDVSVPPSSINDNWQFDDSIVWIRGRHSYKAGFSFNRPTSRTGSSNTPRGNSTANEAGYGLAGWLLGYPSSTLSLEGIPYADSYQNLWSAYVQDDWHATRKLTLNLGLRWDFFQVPRDKQGSWRNLRLDILTTGPDGKKYPTMIGDFKGENLALYDNLGGYFMPRLGWPISHRQTG